MQRPRRAHAVDRRVGRGGDAGRPARHPVFVGEQAAGRWSSATFSSLVGARVLVVGAGDIGTTIGRMLAGFDVELTYVARTARDGVRSTAELPELLPHADVVILIVPVTPETTGMVDAGLPRRHARRRPAGERRAWRRRRHRCPAGRAHRRPVAGGARRHRPRAAPGGHPLWSAPGLLLTPHVGGAVPETNARAAAAVTDQLARVLAGEPLVNVVDRY